MSAEHQELLRFLGSQYAEARAKLDDLRVRALELVVAACIADSREVPPGETPPPGPPTEPVLSEESFAEPPREAAADRDETPWWRRESEAVLQPEPVEVPEADVEEAGDARRDEQPPEPPDDGPPAEPVRGAWEPPTR